MAEIHIGDLERNDLESGELASLAGGSYSHGYHQPTSASVPGGSGATVDVYSQDDVLSFNWGVSQ